VVEYRKVFGHVGFFCSPRRRIVGTASCRKLDPQGIECSDAAQPFISKGQRATEFQTRSFMMMRLSKWLGAPLVIALLASTAAAGADTVAGGKIKSVDADKSTFVLTDTAGKDSTFKLGDNVIVNREGKETKSDLKVGDTINVCYDKGTFTWTAHYILVQEGTSRNSELIRGKVKGYDADKKELTFTNELKKDASYSMGKALVRLNREDIRIENVKIGDHALLIVDTVDGKTILRSVMVDRAG
jgi:hypothetical protein